MTDRSNSFFPAKLSSTACIGKNCSKSRYILKNYQNRRAGRFSVHFAKVFQFRVSFFRVNCVRKLFKYHEISRFSIGYDYKLKIILLLQQISRKGGIKFSRLKTSFSEN